MRRGQDWKAIQTGSNRKNTVRMFAAVSEIVAKNLHIEDVQMKQSTCGVIVILGCIHRLILSEMILADYGATIAGRFQQQVSDVATEMISYH